MIVFRLSKSIYAHDLTGKGAEKSGGRWNSKGTALLYCSESRALCTAEIAVHTPLGNVPLDYELISVELPDHSLITLSSALPT
ncbi:MAG: RES family NAD+ phosphorylase, partial [Saprospiraceae bacterium]